MIKTVAINGSPRMEKGYTAMILNPFLEGMMDAGSETELFYVKRFAIKPCTGEMHCWYEKPGECYIKDDMQQLYPRIKEADILILATPVYIPIPGEMQNVINRLCPLIEPVLEPRDGRTRARSHKDVNISKVVLVSTGGWWEKGNFGAVVRIVEDFTETMSIKYAGSVLRPHASLMKNKGKLTGEGEAVLKAVKKAGYDLVSNGMMSKEILEEVSRPLVSEEKLRQRYNTAYRKVLAGSE